jgi:hypothetical protein
VGDPVVIAGGLFAGGVVSIAWERIPAWRTPDLTDFQTAFAHTLRRVDRLQPALLVVCLASTIGFAVGEGGAARVLDVLAAVGFLTILLGSAAWLVPIQRPLVAEGGIQPKKSEAVVTLTSPVGRHDSAHCAELTRYVGGTFWLRRKTLFGS